MDASLLSTTTTPVAPHRSQCRIEVLVLRMGVPDLPLELIAPIIEHLDPHVAQERNTLARASRVSSGFRSPCQKRLFGDIVLSDRLGHRNHSYIDPSLGTTAALLRALEAEPRLLSFVQTVQVSEPLTRWTVYDGKLPRLLQLVATQRLVGYEVSLKSGTWTHIARMTTLKEALVAPLSCTSLVWAKVGCVSLKDFTLQSSHLRSISFQDVDPGVNIVAESDVNRGLVSAVVQLESLSVDFCSLQFQMILDSNTNLSKLKVLSIGNPPKGALGPSPTTIQSLLSGCEHLELLRVSIPSRPDIDSNLRCWTVLTALQQPLPIVIWMAFTTSERWLSEPMTYRSLTSSTLFLNSSTPSLLA
ncbi:hypothetical protein BKA70DRAFT_526685 [Coprinopsis sp. MPI-PUGE-AT-0042]|nr:hypothetical protein BKA70DRAFT_526685 [Coprinopsis sp. MPI-PUGE-AT-0042]